MSEQKVTEDDKRLSAAREAIEWWLCDECVADWSQPIDLPDAVLDSLCEHIQRVLEAAYKRGVADARKKKR